jgi:hypothetical protein
MSRIIDIRKWVVDINVDLFNAGRTEDGFDFTADVYQVFARKSDGTTYLHERLFFSTDREATDDGVFFPDGRKKQLKLAQDLCAAVKKVGWINLDFWEEAEPGYGSDAYCKKYGF